MHFVLMPGFMWTSPKLMVSLCELYFLIKQTKNYIFVIAVPSTKNNPWLSASGTI